MENNDKEQLDALSLEDLKTVSGGNSISTTYICPFCGKVFEDAGTVLGSMQVSMHKAQHLLENNLPEKKETD